MMNLSDKKLKELKKIELHLHLDGSVRVDTLKSLLKNKEDYEVFKKKVHVSDNCKDLNEYLEKFELPIKVMQKSKNITRITKELCEDLEKENVIYAEIRFAPFLHTKKFLSIDKVVKAVIKGIKNSNIKVKLILCCMRGEAIEKNKKIIDIANKYKEHVGGIDLAGSEATYKTSDYEELFKYAKEQKVLFTIHAGEASGKESVEKAIEFGALRIGHGIHLENDIDLINKIKEKNITLEICPISNIQTKTVESINNHPIKEYYLKGIKTTINTDNKTVSNTNLLKEYILLRDTFNFTLDDFKKMNLYALEGAFIEDDIKEELKKKLGE